MLNISWNLAGIQVTYFNKECFTTLGQLMNMSTVFWGFGLVGALKATILVIVALLLASWISGTVVRYIEKVPVLRSKENLADIVDVICEIVYLIVLLMFVPGICSALGVSSIADPLLDMLSKILMFLPNIIGAVVVLIIGVKIAKILRQLVSRFCGKEKIGRLLKCVGEDSESSDKVSEAISCIVYIAVVVPVFITALQVLNLTSLTEPAVHMLCQIIDFIPNLLVSVFIAGIGLILARIAGRFVETTVGAAGFDAKIQKFIGETYGFSIGTLTGHIARILVVVFFAVEALNSLHMAVLTTIGTAVISYLPNVCVAVVIILLTKIGAGASKRVLSANGMDCGIIASQIAIYMLGGFMVLSQLNIAPHIVNTAFTCLFAGLALTFSIAVGLGAKDTVSKILEEKKLTCKCCTVENKNGSVDKT